MVHQSRWFFPLVSALRQLVSLTHSDKCFEQGVGDHEHTEQKKQVSRMLLWQVSPLIARLFCIHTGSCEDGRPFLVSHIKESQEARKRLWKASKVWQIQDLSGYLPSVNLAGADTLFDCVLLGRHSCHLFTPPRPRRARRILASC